MRGATTEKVRLFGADNSGVADERSERVGTAVCIRSLRRE